MNGRGVGEILIYMDVYMITSFSSTLICIFSILLFIVFHLLFFSILKSFLPYIRDLLHFFHSIVIMITYTACFPYLYSLSNLC